MGVNGITLRSDHFTTTQTVRAAYPDGSALVRSTFTDVSATVNGKTTTYALRGFAIDQRISPRGALLSQKVIDPQATAADVVGQITNQVPIVYPAAPVGLGSTWHQHVPSMIATTILLTIRVLAFGSLRGQPTVTLSESIRQPIHDRYGLLNGHYTATGTTSQIVATGAPVASERIALTIHAAIVLILHGKVVHGTTDVQVTEVIKPVLPPS